MATTMRRVKPTIKFARLRIRFVGLRLSLLNGCYRPVAVRQLDSLYLVVSLSPWPRDNAPRAKTSGNAEAGVGQPKK